MGAQVFRLRHYPRPDDASPQAPSTGTFPKKVSLERRGHGIRIKNLDAPGGSNLMVSFDGGRSYYPIAPGAELDEDCAFHYFFVVSSGAAISWSALVREG